MDTPICDFVRAYASGGALRTHMPGHKGRGALGAEAMDITEIDGADCLYCADGIIKKSEKNAGELFGGETFYSAEGSSLCIRAMLFLAVQRARAEGKKPVIAAGRNAHSAFLSAAAMLDFEIVWLWPKTPKSYLSCDIGPDELEKALSESAEPVCAVYLTTPDYLGGISDLRGISAVCRRHGAVFLVDNAHGAYLRFLPESRHPLDFGADICCDSAHKTLPVLTGGAYLHVSRNAPEEFARGAENAMALFGSTSPSYLILQSLDAANRYLSDSYREKLGCFAEEVKDLKKRLENCGYDFYGGEPLKLTVKAKKYGYDGRELAAVMREKNVFCEFYDPDFVVMMLTPETGRDGLERLERAMRGIPGRPALTGEPPEFCRQERVLSVREAVFSKKESVPVGKSAGRVLASMRVACPPAVPVVICGERIDGRAVKCFEYYGIETCQVAADAAL